MPRTASSKAEDEQPGAEVEGASLFEPSLDRTRRFLEAAALAGKVEPGKRSGTFKGPGRRVLDPKAIDRDFAAVEAGTIAYRKVLGEALESPAVHRARVAPRVPVARAKELLGGKPERVMTDVLVGSFTVSVRYYGERQAPLLYLVDLASAEERPELEASVRAALEAESEPLPARGLDPEEVERALEALRSLAEEGGRAYARSVQDEVAQVRADRRAVMEGYFQGLEEEYEKEERRLFYHLYYFDRAERLAARRKADLSERENLLEEEERYYEVEATVTPVGLALLSLPLYTREERTLCAVSGELL